MKKLFFILLILKLSIISTAQTPQKPDLCLISVGNDSLVHILWNYNDTTKIDGFIVKRIIFNGNGVVNGTMNNIAILPNTTLSYIDTSHSYSTHSEPYKRKETYTVSAFVTTNGIRYLSNLPLFQNTIFLRTKWDKCSKTAFFYWNKYSVRNVEKYQLLFSTDNIKFNILKEFSNTDTSYKTNNLEKNTKYFFKINAILSKSANCTSDTSYSNTKELFTETPIAPEYIKTIKASVESRKNIKINFLIKGGKDIEKYTLIRTTENITKNLENFSGKSKFISYSDTTANTTKTNSYYIKAFDSCKNIISKSKKINNIVLNVLEAEYTFYIRFTPTTLYELPPDNYSLSIDIGNGFRQFADRLNPDTVIKITYTEIFRNNSFPDTLQHIGFRITSTRDSLQSNSNKQYILLSPIINIPNAFNPLSSNPDNRQFSIKTLFIKKFQIIIFNENDQIVFQSKNKNKKWDGRLANGQLAPKGTYIYSIKYTSLNNNKYSKNGIIHLIY